MSRTANLRAGAFALALSIVTLTSPASAVEADLLAVGSPAPDILSEDVMGKPFSLSEALQGGPVMLVFWSLFCGSCMEELPIVQEQLPKLSERVQVVAVNLDEAPRARNVKQVASQKGFTFRMLLNKIERKNPDGTLEKREFQIDQAFKVKATPALFIVNRDGTVAYSHSGPLTPEELTEVVKLAR